MVLHTCVRPGDSHLPDGAVGLPFSAFLALSNLAKISLKAEGVTNDSPSLIASWIWEGQMHGANYTRPLVQRPQAALPTARQTPSHALNQTQHSTELAVTAYCTGLLGPSVQQAVS